ncbi:MMPL family transporter [Gilvimarinus agarilyticus]|uniref:efflux RND transporter permease subunit n=1 Tax=Gilvimarinus sp. 2_MG-2023 TaxID=3062666 RepID=UPI001C08AB18|nr:MMPL family transporter [Gilvimarinus sp. 2_MG-2023]MBU2886125.1 MMPL family transporter [Gilvimarinus agarilyticus]MDO6570835.1 MMPL family transporter [Gilvimarinus sp. 2_MG-2023]
MLSSLQSLYRYLITRRSMWVLVGLVLLTAVTALGLPNFKLDASADSLTLESDNSLDYFREVNQRYQSGDFLVVTYTPNAPMFSEQSLATLEQLQGELANVQGVSSINSILSVPLLYSPMRSLAEQQESTRTLLTPGVDKSQAREEFLTSPIYRDTLLSDDGKTTAIQLNLAVDNRYIEMVRERDALRAKQAEQALSPAEETQLEAISAEFLAYRTQVTAQAHQRVEAIRQILVGYQSEAELFLGGVSMITADMIEFIRSDLVVFGAAIIVFIILMLALIFRQWRFVILPLAVCVMAVVSVLGLLSWVDWRLTVISSNFVALLLIMTLAITIHLVVRYRELHARHPDWSQEQLVMSTAGQMIKPCLYTALTTIVAFVSLVVSDIRPVIDFGWMMTIGLSYALVLAFLLLPAALMVLPKGTPRDKGDQSAATTLRFSRVAEKHGASVIVVALIAAAVSGYGITQLEVENRFIDYFHEDTEIYQGMSVIDRQLGGTVSLDIVLNAKEVTPVASEASEKAAQDVASDDDEFGFDEPFAETNTADESDAFDDPFGGDPFAEDSQEHNAAHKDSAWFNPVGLQTVGQIHRYLESLPEVGKVQSLHTIGEVTKDINGGKLNNFELTVVRNMLSDDIRNFLVDPYLSDEAGQTRITLRVKETSPDLKRAELVEKIRTYIVQEAGLAPEQVQFTGMLVLYNNMLQSLFTSQIVTLGAVFLGIMFMFLVLFRSITIAIISLLPNLLAASVVLGGMGLYGIPLDMMTITIAAITVGVGVDHAIHYLYRFRSELANSSSYVEAMHKSHASIGRAMYYTAVIIIVGFLILTLSEFIPSIYFGALTALAMFAAILGSLTLLPKLVLITKPFGKIDSARSSEP